MASRFELDGWQGHYWRTRRWFERLLRAAADSPEDVTEQVDMAIVFFQSAYHLRDYLKGAVDDEALNELFATSQTLRACRDLCVGSKHRSTTSTPYVDGEPWMIRSYRPPGVVLRVKIGEMYDVGSLAGQCMDSWDGFLAQVGLDKYSLSQQAAAYVKPRN